MVPDTWPTIPDLRTPSVEEPTPDAPTHGDRRSSRRSSGSADRPVTTRDLIDMAHGARGEDSVVVPVHGVEPSVPLRSTPGIAHLDVLGVGLRDVLDPDDVHTSDRGQRTLGGQSLSRGFDASYDRSDDHNADYQRYGYVRSDFGYERSTAGYDRSAVGYHRAYTSYDTTDVSFSRPRCGRHRA
jgi:hypothetical protein